MSCKATETTDSEQTEALVEKIQSLEQQLDQSLFEQNQLKLKLEEQASLVRLLDSHAACQLVLYNNTSFFWQFSAVMLAVDAFYPIWIL